MSKATLSAMGSHAKATGARGSDMAEVLAELTAALAGRYEVDREIGADAECH